LKDIASIALRAILFLLATILALEIVLQFGFTRLPNALVNRMPQYHARIGWQLNTEHGAREYPAWQVVEYDVTPLTGDLFTLTCLEPRDAQPIDNYKVSFRRDGHGFRNAEPWPDDVDTVVIGDSFTDAELIQRPFWQGISDTVLALGMRGSGTLEQQQLFEAYGLPRSPETLVVAFFAGNDLRDNESTASMIRKHLTWYDRYIQDSEPHEFLVVLRTLHWIVELTLPNKEIWCHYPYFTITDPPAPIAFYHRFVRRIGENAASIMQREGLTLTRSSLSEMNTTLQANDGELILMYIPSKPELYWKYLDAQTKRRIIDHESRRFDNMPQVSEIDENVSDQRDLMRGLAEELGISFLDLTPALDEAIRSGQSPYFFADTHWNQQGHNIARNALLDFLNRSNLEK